MSGNTGITQASRSKAPARVSSLQQTVRFEYFDELSILCRKDHWRWVAKVNKAEMPTRTYLAVDHGGILCQFSSLSKP